ncbi:MAG: alpha/beta hydrolase family protein, partial [Treponema sp.]|nr:alpha/beta hydrolase family protein [Treponema sp.]
MLKKSLVFAVTAALSMSLFAEGSKEYVKQEINANDRCLPTFYEKILNKWEFSMEWKDGSNPKKWKEAGLAKARELIIQNEDKTPFDMVVIAEEQREGYKAQKIVFNISEESRVLAYLLIPDKAKKAPAALMLHDHGSKFT